MWAFLAFTLVIAVNASDPVNKTEEKLVIARGKLLVSMLRNIKTPFKVLSHCDHKTLKYFTIAAFTNQVGS